MNAALYVDLGRIRYGPAFALQHRLHALRREGKVPDVVLALEHDPVITVGCSGKEGHILLSPDELVGRGVEVFPVERGGDVTYHGPGQLVLYPILDLRERGKDLRRFVWALEEIMIRVARALGVVAERRRGFPGVWHERGKLGAIGIHVRDWVTMHGLALNVDLTPDGFQWIVPCGIAGARAVSIADLVGPVPLEAVKERAGAVIADVLGVELAPLGGEVIAAWQRSQIG